MSMLQTTLVIVHQGIGVPMGLTDLILLVIILQRIMHRLVMTLVHIMTAEKQAMEEYVQLGIIALKDQKHRCFALQGSTVLFQSSVRD